MSRRNRPRPVGLLLIEKSQTLTQDFCPHPRSSASGLFGVTPWCATAGGGGR